MVSIIQRFHCSWFSIASSACNIEKLGMGLETRLGLALVLSFSFSDRALFEICWFNIHKLKIKLGAWYGQLYSKPERYDIISLFQAIPMFSLKSPMGPIQSHNVHRFHIHSLAVLATQYHTARDLESMVARQCQSVMHLSMSSPTTLHAGNVGGL